jgi:hypothetical protein
VFVVVIETKIQKFKIALKVPTLTCELEACHILLAGGSYLMQYITDLKLAALMEERGPKGLHLPTATHGLVHLCMPTNCNFLPLHCYNIHPSTVHLLALVWPTHSLCPIKSACWVPPQAYSISYCT